VDPSGIYMMAVADRLYYSTNSGTTWTIYGESPLNVNLNHTGVAVSTGGTYATTITGGATGMIYQTSNGIRGTYTRLSAPQNQPFSGVAMSSSGQYQAVVSSGASGKMYVSGDYGQTFTEITTESNRDYRAVSVSADGEYVIAVTFNGLVYKNMMKRLPRNNSYNISQINSDNILHFTDTDGSDLMTLNSLGDLVLSNPTSILKIANGSKLQIANNNSDYTLIGTHTLDDVSNTRIVINGINQSSSPGTIFLNSTATGSNYSHRFINLRGSASDPMVILANGNVGIGNTSPVAPLHIGSNATSTIAWQILIVGGSGGGVQGNSGNSPQQLAAKFDSAIYVTNYIFINSDQRIKKNIQIIDDYLALEKLRLIEPKTYNYIDEITKGTTTVFGFIAQQVKENFPEAVDIREGVIPNIYQFREIVKINDQTIQINNFDFDISENDQIKIFDRENEKIMNVLYYNKEEKYIYLRTTKDQVVPIIDNHQKEVVFVYGKQIQDFHGLNKDYLFTINFAATQELDRVLDWHTKEVDRSVSGDATTAYGESLLTKIKALEQENTTLKTQIQDILTRLQNAGL
jgi:hypothetical protein